MQYAVIESGGKQQRVREGDVIYLEKLSAEEGETVHFERVLMLGGDGQIEVGKPFLSNIRVAAEVLEHGKHDKLLVFKFKRRKKYRRTQGHRQHFTKLKITRIATETESAGVTDNGA